METALLNTTKLLQRNKGLFRDSNNEFDLITVIQKLKSEIPVEKGELVTRILLRSPEMRIVIVKMNEGTEIFSFQKDQSVTFLILEGKMILHIRKESLTLYKGESHVLNEKTKYSIASVDSTILLMTMAS
jgi:mannose-6-phosphate isomerase-like protein (cupin superfamily)